MIGDKERLIFKLPNKQGGKLMGGRITNGRTGDSGIESRSLEYVILWGLENRHDFMETEPSVNLNYNLWVYLGMSLGATSIWEPAIELPVENVSIYEIPSTFHCLSFE